MRQFVSYASRLERGSFISARPVKCTTTQPRPEKARSVQRRFCSNLLLSDMATSRQSGLSEPFRPGRAHDGLSPACKSWFRELVMSGVIDRHLLDVSMCWIVSARVVAKVTLGWSILRMLGGTIVPFASDAESSAWHQQSFRAEISPRR